MNNPNILLVEGIADKAVLEAIYPFDKEIEKELGFGRLFEVDPGKKANGFDNLLKDLPTLVKKPERTVGIIFDADYQDKNWNKLKTILADLGYSNIPEKLNGEPLILANPHTNAANVKLGIWMMPNNQSEGMLEDFICDLVAKDNELMAFVDECLPELEKRKLKLFDDIHKQKARINTWLAWQKRSNIEDNAMAVAIKEGYIKLDQKPVIQLQAWINELFTETTPSLTH